MFVHFAYINLRIDLLQPQIKPEYSSMILEHIVDVIFSVEAKQKEDKKNRHTIEKRRWRSRSLLRTVTVKQFLTFHGFFLCFHRNPIIKMRISIEVHVRCWLLQMHRIGKNATNYKFNNKWNLLGMNQNPARSSKMHE